MKTFVSLGLLVTSLIFLNVACGAPGPSPSALISNGDFQVDTGDKGWPDGWGSKPVENGKNLETEGAMHFMRLALQPPCGFQVLYREVNLKPAAVKGINIAVRYRSPTPNAFSSDEGRAILFFRDKSGALIDPPPDPLFFSRQPTGWCDQTRQMPVPAAATRMIIMVGLFGSSVGSIDIGGITCTILDDAESRKLIAPKQAISAKSWVTNDDFAKARAAGDWPEDWGTPAPGMSWLLQDGARFVRIVSQKPEESLMLGRTIPIKKGVRGINLQIRFRATGVEHGDHEWFDSRTIVHFLGPDGKQLANEGRNLDVIYTHKPAPTGWVDRGHFLIVPDGATQVQLRSGLFQAKAGTVDLAVIRVTPLSDTDTDLLKTADMAYDSWKADVNAETERKIEGQIRDQLLATGDLAPNGSFALATKTPAWPDGWGSEPLPGLSWEQEGGIHFIRLTGRDPQKVVMLYKMVILSTGLKTVNLSLRYRLSAFTKGDTAPGDARMPLHFLDGTRFGHLENGKDLKPDLPDVVFSPTEKWTEIHRRLLVPPGATKLQLMPALWNVKAGTLDLTDIHVIPVTDADGSALAPSLSGTLAQ
jgi:hypothetical protein